MARGDLKKYQALFPNYKLRAKHISVLSAFENSCGYEIMGGDQVTDIKSFNHCVRHNMQWLHDLADETQKITERTANAKGFNLYDI